MLLAAGSVSEFLRVVQIVSWIVFPILAIFIGGTVYFHYRRKKKNRAEALAVNDVLPAPATLAQLGKDADYVLFDHTGLFHEYHKKLCHTQAMYSALQHKFSALEVKCAAMAAFVTGKSPLLANVSAYPAVKREIDQFVKKINADRKQWESANLQLTNACIELQKENQLLRSRLEAATNTGSFSRGKTASIPA